MKQPSRESLWDGQFYQRRKPAPSGPAEVLKSAWDSLDSISKLSGGIIAVNGAIALTENMPNLFWDRLWHIPADGRNYTLFTSAFVHSGLMHLGFNMYCLWNFLPIIGHSPVFKGDPYHISAFYLSAAVLSSYGQHLNTLWLKNSRYVMSGGASGAIFAIIGAFATMYPHEKMGIMFLPFSFDAQSLLGGLMAFDAIGAAGLLKSLQLGHGAHLTGALLGIAYVRFDGYHNLWLPMTTFFKRLRST
jgi:rhomboid-like protein